MSLPTHDGAIRTGVSRRILFRRRLLIWRARLSIPSLLAHGDERGVVCLFAAAYGGMAILGISALAWLINLPVLFPALGPSAFLLFTSPFSEGSVPRKVIVAHSLGIGAGYAVWRLISAIWGEPISLANQGWPTFVSASLALAATSVLLVWFAAPHAPACASALIVALGMANDWRALLGMASGVVFLTALSVVMNRFAGVHSPTWSARMGL